MSKKMYMKRKRENNMPNSERAGLLEEASEFIYRAMENIREAVRGTDEQERAEQYILSHLQSWIDGMQQVTIQELIDTFETMRESAGAMNSDAGTEREKWDEAKLAKLDALEDMLLGAGISPDDADLAITFVVLSGLTLDEVADMEQIGALPELVEYAQEAQQIQPEVYNFGTDYIRQQRSRS